ncbi:MAG TPA: hypothetical protein VGX23_30450 [Actinocrinis sp.]|nr:hypothetical protein [Actinocrinis sp.]
MTSSHGDHADAIVQRLFRASLEVTSALALADDHAAGPLREVIEHLDAAIRLIQRQALEPGPETATFAPAPYRHRPRLARLVGRAGIRPAPSAPTGLSGMRRPAPGPATD